METIIKLGSLTYRIQFSLGTNFTENTIHTSHINTNILKCNCYWWIKIHHGVAIIALGSYCCIVADYWKAMDKAKKKKRNLFYGRTDSKKGSVGHFFFLQFFAKLPKKIVIISCSLYSKIFIQIFVQKLAALTFFWEKK